MTEAVQFLGTLVGCVIMLFILVFTFGPPSSSGESSWLRAFNKWALDPDWEQEVGGRDYLLTKASLTDDSLILVVMCGVNEPTLAVAIFSDPSRRSTPDSIKLTFDGGPYFEEIWSQKDPHALLQGGDKTAPLLRPMLTSDVLGIDIEGGGVAQDDYKFYLGGFNDMRTTSSSSAGSRLRSQTLLCGERRAYICRREADAIGRRSHQ